MKLVGSSRAVRSPEFHKKKVRERILRTLALVVLASAIILVPILILRHDKFIIETLSVSGNEVTGDAEIETLARESLAGAILGVLPRASAVLAPQDEIEERLLASMPRLSAAEVSLAGMKALSISVTERKPYGLYCEDEDMESAKQCFFLDESGYIFAEAPYFSGGVYMIYAVRPELPDPIGQSYLPAEEFARLNDFIQGLREIGIEPASFTVSYGEYSLALSGGTDLKWKSEQNFDSLLRDFESFLKDPKMKPLRLEDLVYIDLRFDNKVFYRFRNE